MRILQIEKMLYASSGVTSAVGRLGELLRQAGHDVLLFGCAEPGAKGKQLSEFPRYIDFAARRRAADLPLMIHNDSAARAMDRFLDRNPVDVAHVHNIYHHLTPAILPVLARRRIGIVLTSHDYRLACPTKHFLRPDGVCMRCLPARFHHSVSPRCAGLAGVALGFETFWQRFFRRYWRWADIVLCPSEFMRQVLLKIGPSRSKLVYCPNAVKPIEVCAPPSEAPKGLLFVGRISAEKGPDLMLDLAGRLTWAKIVVVGDGPMLPKLRDRLAREKLSNVQLTGAVGRDAVGSYLTQAGAVVLPSRCMENSPQSMLEAMWAGRCVIAPDHPPLREWVTDGRTGRTFRPGDGGDLARVAEEVLTDQTARSAMAAAGRELVKTRHDGQAVLAMHENAYREAIRRCAWRW